MTRWHNSVIRTRYMPGWWFRLGSLYYRARTRHAIRKLNRLVNP